MNSSKEILKMVVKKESGITSIFVQSDVDWSPIFNSNGGLHTFLNCQVAEIKPSISKDNNYYYHHTPYANNMLEYDGKVNLAFLASPDLNVGVTFITNYLHKNVEIESFCSKYKKQASSLWNQYLKPIHQEFVLTAHETSFIV